MSRRVLVVEHQHTTDEAVQRLLTADSGDEEFVVVVVPVLVSGLRYWTNDDTEGRRTAVELVRTGVDALLTTRRVRGYLGDSNPLQAIADALARFAPDEVAVVGP
jgi:hypothetical protein